MPHSAGVDGCAWSGSLTGSTSLRPPGRQESHQRGIASDITELADLGKQLFSLLLPLFPLTEQSEQAVAATKEASGSPTKSLAALNELIQRTAGRAIAAEKDMVEFATNQNKAVSEAIKQKVGAAGTPVVVTATEMMQHAVDALLANQREFLDVAAKLSKTIAAKA